MKHLLYIFVLLLLPISVFSQGNLQEKIQNMLNDKTIEDPYERWDVVYKTTANDFSVLQPEEAILIYNDMIAFVEREIKDKPKRNMAKASIYNDMRLLYSFRGEPDDFAIEEKLMKKAIEHAELSNDNATRAYMYKEYGGMLSTCGTISMAHEFFYKAINLFKSVNNYDKIFHCFYLIAENLLQTRDLAGLNKVIEQMQFYIDKYPSNHNYYNLFSVQAAYYCILSEDHPENYDYKEKSLIYSRKIIQVVEKEPNITYSNAFNYYNVAVTFRNSYPTQYDSIYYFLNKALESAPLHDKPYTIELEICVYQLYAEVHFAQKNYKQAEKDIFYVLSLLEEVKDNNSVVVDFSEAYKFLVLYYETLNRPAEAFKYHKLLLENEKRRYENDKIVAMNDMLVKYEVEKKNEQLDRMAERAKTTRTMLLLSGVLIVVLVMVMIILVRFQKLRKQRLEQSVYEAALLAELKQNELDTELQRIKKHLEQKPTKAMIVKLTEWISQSPIEKTKEKEYIQQLSELDIEMLEQGYLTSDEKISNMDMKYIICFAMDMDVKDMSLLFNVEPASIRTVRYRIKKKFGKKNTFKFLM